MKTERCTNTTVYCHDRAGQLHRITYRLWLNRKKRLKYMKRSRNRLTKVLKLMTQ